MADYVDAFIEQSALNSAFNAQQAELNRDWQEYMSGTSHQREVQDLILAGLNPVLSANSGSTFSAVGNPTADASSAAGLASLAMTSMNNRASIEMSRIAAAAQVAAASSAAAISAQATRDAANISAEASRDTAPVTVSGSAFGTGGSVSMPSHYAEDIINSANTVWDNYWNTNDMSGNYSQGSYRHH